MPNQVQVKTTKSKKPPRGWVKAHRAVSYQAPPPSRIRRILHFFFNAYTVSFSALMVLFAALTLTYFWFEYSDRIDMLLKGDVFTQSAGIYSAPKNLRENEPITPAGLIEYLKSAGYIEKNNQADASRSRYEIKENQIEIEPGVTGTVDGQKYFHQLSVKFKKDGKTVEKITDIDVKKDVNTAQLEPKILSSIAAEGDGRRKTITFSDLPNHLVKSIITTEDRAFFEHYGVNFRGIARAAYRRYEKENDDSPLANQGGSSITQQLVKNLWLNREQTLTRKIKEAFMSIILETRLTKEEIFTLYANQIYLGQQSGVSIYGVGEAANVYFGKDVSQLTLAESAFLAGIIRSPNRYNAYKNPERVAERRNQVLDSMFQSNAISQEDYQAAKQTKLVLNQVASSKDLQGMPYFSQYAIEELPKVVSDPEALQHLRVYTTIDPDLQKLAYQIVAKRLERLDKYFPKKEKGSLNAALVAIKPKTGEIVAMVGGRDYQQNQFNRATDAMRQPGSVFKPFVYALALNSAYDSNSRIFTPATMLKDEKKTFTFGTETYSPNNYGDTFSNQELTLRDALVKSKNTITVDLGMELNVGKVMNFAAKAGLPKVEKAYPSMSLGTAEATPLQMATAYTVFANLGDKITPMPISRVTDGAGKTVNAPSIEKKNVLRPDVAYIMDDIMKDVINRGTAAEVKAWGFQNVAGKFGYAGKTGTSRDGWFAGFTPELVVVVYVGFDNGDDLGMKGSDSAMPIWADFMREALGLHPEWNGDWQMPANIKKGEIDIRNGKLLRELSNEEADSVKTQQALIKKNQNSNSNSQTQETPQDIKNIFVTDVPVEFRRVELFVFGTLPNKLLLPTEEVKEISEQNETQPRTTPTPFTTWEQEQRGDSGNQNTQPQQKQNSSGRTVMVMICPLSGARATMNCPTKEMKTFDEGKEPKDFCQFHRGK